MAWHQPLCFRLRYSGLKITFDQNTQRENHFWRVRSTSAPQNRSLIFRNERWENENTRNIERGKRADLPGSFPVWPLVIALALRISVGATMILMIIRCDAWYWRLPHGAVALSQGRKTSAATQAANAGAWLHTSGYSSGHTRLVEQVYSLRVNTFRAFFSLRIHLFYYRTTTTTD